MKKKETFPQNVGTRKVPLDFGHGLAAYRRNGQWRYRNSQTMGKFIEATDEELTRELHRRGYQILYPAHECVDRPDLPCPACEMDAKRMTRTA